VGRHEADSPDAGLASRRLTGSPAGWALGAGTVAVLAFALWSLGGDDAEPPPPGIFGAAIRPGIFDLDSGTTSSDATADPTSVPPPSVTTEHTITTNTITAATGATSAPTTNQPTTTTTLSPLIMRPDGLGAVDLGAGFDEAIDAVTARLGPATEDTGWISASSDFGTCPGTVVRMVRWSSLRLLFSDGPTEFGDENYHFFYYSQSTVGTEEVLDLQTAEGAGLDSTVADLKSAYGADLTIESTLRFGVSFFVQPIGPGLLSGTLTDSTDEGAVTALGGGFGCGG